MKLFGLQIGKRAVEFPVKQKRGRHPKSMARDFAAANIDRLTASFTGSSLSANEAIRRDLRVIRGRSRTLCMDNDYARKFLQMVKANVIGTNGIQLQCKFTNERGQADNADSDYVETEFKQWAKPRNCSANGRQSWADIQRQVIETVARDGECLVQMIKIPYGRYGLHLRVLECDHLDIELNRELDGGHKIKMGIESNQFDLPIAYYLKTKHPGEITLAGRENERVPASEILHIFISDRPGQIRGVPWMHTAIRRLNMLGGYEMSELIAARVGASKMGFYTSPDGDGYIPPSKAAKKSHNSVDSKDQDDYSLIVDAEPGTFEQLPSGMGFTSFDPQHPTSAFADFTKAVLRGAASGLNVAYNTLANDLEGVNFSSIRSGVLEEREQWRGLQSWLIEQLHEPVYQIWIDEFLMRGSNPLPHSKIYSKYNRIAFQPRGWDWVDPLKDTKANAEGVALGTMTRADIAAAKGKDLREIFEQLQKENELAAEYGLTLTNTPTTPEGLDNAET